MSIKKGSKLSLSFPALRKRWILFKGIEGLAKDGFYGGGWSSEDSTRITDWAVDRLDEIESLMMPFIEEMERVREISSKS